MASSWPFWRLALVIFIILPSVFSSKVTNLTAEPVKSFMEETDIQSLTGRTDQASARLKAAPSISSQIDPRKDIAYQRANALKLVNEIKNLLRSYFRCRLGLLDLMGEELGNAQHLLKDFTQIGKSKENYFERWYKEDLQYTEVKKTFEKQHQDWVALAKRLVMSIAAGQDFLGPFGSEKNGIFLIQLEDSEKDIET